MNEELLKAVREILSIARRDFKHAGELMTAAYIFYRDEGRLAVRLLVVPEGFESDDQKGIFSRTIEDHARHVHAVGVLFLAESWAVDGIDLRAHPEWIGRLFEHPDRREVVNGTLSTPNGGYMFNAHIERDGDSVSLGEFSERAVEVSGRFASFFDKVN